LQLVIQTVALYMLGQSVNCPSCRSCRWQLTNDSFSGNQVSMQCEATP